MNNKVLIDSIEAYDKLYGLPTRNPLVTVVNLKDAQSIANNLQITYGIYALFLKNGSGCALKYGLKTYDFAKGTVVTFSPGKTIDVQMTEDEITDEVIGILFHKDFVKGTTLEKEIADYRFLHYSHMEAIALTDEEIRIYTGCLANISLELDEVDDHSHDVIIANLCMLLRYLNRCYERQNPPQLSHTGVAAQLKQLLDDYYTASAKISKLPEISYFAKKLGISSKHLSAQIRKETGMNAKEFIADFIVSLAKYRLTVHPNDISATAYSLGFRHPAHFSRMFKRLTGQTPTEYRENIKTGEQ